MRNYAKDFLGLVIKLGGSPSDTDFVVKREDFIDWLIVSGYSQRTADNHSYPSRKGGMIHFLLENGLIVDGRLKRWIVPKVKALVEFKVKKVAKGCPTFLGNPPGRDWIPSCQLDDCEEDGLEWRLYRQEYETDCNNLKVVAIGKRVPYKANYWMRSKHGKVLMTREAVLLQKHRPSIFANLVSDIQDMYEGKP